MSQESLEQLLAERAAIDAEFAPTTHRYYEMARKALDLQVKIIDLTLGAKFPKANTLKASKIMTIPARLHVEKVNDIINRIANDESVTVLDVVYDSVAQEYHLYGK